MENSDLENKCRKLLTVFQEILAWDWDGRFQTHLGEFSKADKAETIHSLLKSELGFIWDSATIDAAPESVQAIDNNLGGLRPGQLLFTSDPAQGELLFCAWWPWGNDVTISIRIGPSREDLLT